MKSHLEEYHVDYFWTNSGHQLADGFTKLSTGGGRTDLLLSAVSTGTCRIVYSDVSGRKEAKEKQQYECYDEECNNMHSLDDEDVYDTTETTKPGAQIDGWDKFYFDVQ